MQITKGNNGYFIARNTKTKKAKFVPFELVQDYALLERYALLYCDSKHGGKVDVYCGLEYCIYFLEVWQETEKNKVQVSNIELRGVAYHLDHIVPIHYGYVNKICHTLIGSKENLQMLTALQNLSKGRNLTEPAKELLKLWKRGN